MFSVVSVLDDQEAGQASPPASAVAEYWPATAATCHLHTGLGLQRKTAGPWACPGEGGTGRDLDAWGLIC